MARVGTLSGHPNVLVVTGRDVWSRDPDDDDRDRLRDLLYDRDRGPVREGSHDFWITYPIPQVRDAPSRFAHEDLGKRPRPLRGIEYNDLELALMGVIRPQSAYGGGLIHWMNPRLTAPLRDEVGIFVAFSRYDFIHFGFQQDHRKLVARRAGERGYQRVSLRQAYRPLASRGFNGAQLRIVRRGNQYHCQAR